VRVLGVLALAVALAGGLSACGSSTGLTQGRLQASFGPAFARLYALQQAYQGNPKVDPRKLDAAANCAKNGDFEGVQDGPGLWVCTVTFLIAGPGYPVIAKYNVHVQTDGCYAADGDGPASLNGSPTVTGPGYAQLNNPLTLIDACFDTT
jgi:ABC-2 type transport system permease protein